MTPQAERLLRYFTFQHLPAGPARDMSQKFTALATELANTEAVDGAEQTVALRHLLEAKDAAVRCVIPTGK